MHLASRYLSFIFLTAALTASAAPKDAAAQEVVVQVDHPRYYDRNHRDYHEWNDREDRSYRLYLGEHHRDYRDFHEIAVANKATTGIGAITTQIAISPSLH